MCNWVIKEFDTIADAIGSIKQDTRTTILHNEFSPINVISVCKKKEYAIIIQDYNSGIKPTIIEFGNKIWVGTNFSIECFNFDLEKIRSISLLAPVYDFICNETYNLIIAICEIDIFCLNMDGNIVWHEALSDIICEYKLHNNILTYSLFEGGIYSIDITNFGAPISHNLG